MKLDRKETTTQNFANDADVFVVKVSKHQSIKHLLTTSTVTQISPGSRCTCYKHRISCDVIPKCTSVIALQVSGRLADRPPFFFVFSTHNKLPAPRMAPHPQLDSLPMSEKPSSFRNPEKKTLMYKTHTRNLSAASAPAPHFHSEMVCARPDC